MNSFQTSKGSTYTVNPDNTTQRFKVKHVGHSPSDVGLKESSDLTLYISEKACDELCWNIKALSACMIIFEEGIALAYRENEDDWKFHEVGYAYTKTPEVGRHPVEFWGIRERVEGQLVCSKYHIGNKIVSIN